MSQHQTNLQKTPPLVACTEPGCPKKDCRGAAGLHMHIQRAHKRNWSTKRKEA